jgi:ParB-like chromosome segregation protein Spo0J
MHIEMRPIESITPYDKNPRVNDPGVDAVAASIKEFGFRQPIVVDEQDVIIVGHTRYKAALKLGLKMVPVHVAVGLTPAQAKAYRIADNQTAALSQFDDNLLSLELAELQALDFDLNLTGFSADELLRLLQSEGLAHAAARHRPRRRLRSEKPRARWAASPESGERASPRSWSFSADRWRAF